MEIFEIAKNLLEKKNLNYFQSEDLIKFDVEGENGGWPIYLKLIEEERLALVYSIVNNKTPYDKLNDMAIFLTKLNFGLKTGNFELNMDTGEIHFKTYVEMLNEDEDEKYLERAIMHNIFAVDHYLTEIMRIMYATA